MPLMYAQLTEKQKCMYHAWGRTEEIKKEEWGTKLGPLVTNTGADADDSVAALIFAKTFGFSRARGCTGKQLHGFIADVNESCWYVVLVLEKYAKEGKEFKPSSDYFTGSSRDVDVLLRNPEWEYLFWHAIVCDVEVPSTGARKVTWYDDQESRYNAKGPGNERWCIFFSRWKK